MSNQYEYIFQKHLNFNHYLKHIICEKQNAASAIQNNHPTSLRIRHWRIRHGISFYFNTIKFYSNFKVEQVKQQIAEAKGKDSFPVDVQKLIFNGKVLEDGQTLPEVAQGKFIVVMVVKVKNKFIII